MKAGQHLTVSLAPVRGASDTVRSGDKMKRNREFAGVADLLYVLSTDQQTDRRLSRILSADRDYRKRCSLIFRRRELGLTTQSLCDPTESALLKAAVETWNGYAAADHR